MNIPSLKIDSHAERCALGCIMHAGMTGDDEALDLLFELTEADFHGPDNRRIFTAALQLRERRQPIDPQLVAREVGNKDGAGLILAVAQEVTGTALAGSYVEILKAATKQRSVVFAALDALKAVDGLGGANKAAEILRKGLESVSDAERGATVTTGAQAAAGYLKFLTGHNRQLLRAALPELDSALGGGVDFGEMVILAARPSHGKTAIALQFAHHWTEDQIPVLYVSLEMSANALGKRIMQYSSSVPEEYWRSDINNVCNDVERHLGARAELYIADGLTDLDRIVREIDRSVKTRGVRAVIVDYAQLIKGPGKTRYEQITNISTVLRTLASEHNIAMLVLCQMSREIESRKKFVPIMSDIKESGQFEQDADVVVFLVWPNRIDRSAPANEYQFFIAKNRNRPIVSSAFTARFEPSRQRVVSPTVKDMPNYESCFEEFAPDYGNDQDSWAN